MYEFKYYSVGGSSNITAERIKKFYLNILNRQGNMP